LSATGRRSLATPCRHPPTQPQRDAEGWLFGALDATELADDGAGGNARVPDDAALAAAAAWLPGLAGAAVVGEGLDVDEVAVPVGVGDGDGLGDVLCDVDDGLGLGLGELLGLPDGEGLRDGFGDVQLRRGDADVGWPGPVAPPGPE
jgi:hypothetical protein